VFFLFKYFHRYRHTVFHIPLILYSIPPLDQRDGRVLSAASNLDAGDTPGMHTGTSVVIAVVGFELFRDLICSFSTFQQHMFGQGQVFIDPAVGMTGRIE